ncbi:MAG: site-specific DNA-methyltransferase [Candidatus Fermentibacteraceae bacterium]|nr:site-specific DNA-methyltransferase [Candidatus Fermentibacteraceae bacterium]
MRSRTKLELTWINKGKHPKLEPRILLEDPEKSYHAKRRISNEDVFENMLIHGDNLLALKALEHEYTNRVKCIYIDSPFNIGAAVEHYDDGIEHSQWLNIMYERVIILRRLLAEDGSIFVHIDNEEQAYLKVILDEVFDRRNFCK